MEKQVTPAERRTRARLAAELRAARQRIGELEHTVTVLNTAVANYRDAFSLLQVESEVAS